MVKWTATNHCLSHLHCLACRTDADWRQSLVNIGLLKKRDFDCPYGITELTAEKEVNKTLLKLGQIIPKKNIITNIASKSCCYQK